MSSQSQSEVRIMGRAIWSASAATCSFHDRDVVQKILGDPGACGEDRRIFIVARPGQGVWDDLVNLARPRRHEDQSISEKRRLENVMGHKQDRLSFLFPQ